jgi:hypothetical protein
MMMRSAVGQMNAVEERSVDLHENELQQLKLLAERLNFDDEERDDEGTDSLASDDLAPVIQIKVGSLWQVSELCCLSEKVVDMETSHPSSLPKLSAPRRLTNDQRRKFNAKTDRLEYEQVPALVRGSFRGFLESLEDICVEGGQLDSSDRIGTNTSATCAVKKSTKRMHRSSLVSENSGLDPSWFASRGLMSANSYKKYKKEIKKHNFFRANSSDSTIITSASMVGAEKNSQVMIIGTEKLERGLVTADTPSFCRSASLDDGIESVAELFVRAIAMSTERERQAAFAYLGLNGDEVAVRLGWPRGCRSRKSTTTTMPTLLVAITSYEKKMHICAYLT